MPQNIPLSGLESPDTSRGLLHVNLDAVAKNYRALQTGVSPGVECGACVKADGYGLGREAITRTLAAAGCQDFFVAYPEGGVRLRQLLPDVNIHVFSGIPDDNVQLYRDHELIPVLNSLSQIDRWATYGKKQGQKMPADIHVDTGMCRLGLSPDEVNHMGQSQSLPDEIAVDIVMSHLACSDRPGHPLNQQQLIAFRQAREKLPMGRASLANSSGIFLGSDYHFDLVRPGAALYGINPTPGLPSPVSQVIRLQGKILQVRSVEPPQTIGYSALHVVTKPSRIATVGVGYADGYLRLLSGHGTAYINGTPAPVVGRVSMDMITVDVSNISEQHTQPGLYVDLIDENNDADALGKMAGTIGYEILTGLNGRLRKVYHGGVQG